jgi:hypothetical protein
MPVLDLNKGWRAYDDAQKATDNSRHKAILETMKDHIKWEVLGHPEKVLETVADGGSYHFYGLGDYIEFPDYESIKGFYQSMVDNGTNVLQLDIDHLAVADWGIAAHGTWHQAFPMADLPDKLPNGFVPDDADARYLVSSRLAWFFPFTEDEVPKLISEIVYFDPVPTAIRKLDADEVLYETLDETVFA